MEALKKLASKANIEIDIDVINNSSEEEKEKIIIRQINLDASIIYQKFLRSNDGKMALKILRDRGLKDETISKFDIGYSPDSYDMIYKQLSKKYSDNLLAKAQIISSTSGNIIDTFRNRIMIPIKSISGNVIAFGGRAVLPEQQPKYLNSSETPVFSKRRTLFGISNAIAAIRKERKAIIVEGYFDTIMMHQYMFNIAVSPLGTSFTYEHANILKNYVDEIIIMFDSDEAGVRAAIKAADIITDAGIYTRIALLPTKMDPDEYLIKNGTDDMISLINNSPDIIEFKINIIKNKKYDLSPDKKLHILEFLYPTMIRQKNEVIRSEWVKRVSSAFDISESVINNYLIKNSKEIKQQLNISTNSDDLLIEQNLIDILINNPKVIFSCEDFSAKYLSSDFAKKVYEYIEKEADNERVIESLTEALPEYKERIMKILISEKNTDETSTISNFKKTVNLIKKNYLETEWKELKSRINTLSPEELKRFNELSIELKNTKI